MYLFNTCKIKINEDTAFPALFYEYNKGVHCYTYGKKMKSSFE